MSKTIEFLTKNKAETEKIAIDFAKGLHGGETVALFGELGSGKTTFVKGLAKGLGIKDLITSPTFVFMKEYSSNLKFKTCLAGRQVNNLKLLHIDCYRLESADDAISLGITEYFNNKIYILAIEWAEKIKKILPKNIIQIQFRHDSKNNRKIKISIV